jgi:1-deoxy-D-xylulose-5-phosphate synthase
MLAEALRCDGPSAVRYPRGEEGAYREGGAEAVRELRKGSDLTILSYGTLINDAMEAAERLEREGISARVVKLGRIAPLDLDAVERLTSDTAGTLIVEECAAAGSVGEALALQMKTGTILALNLGDGIVRQGTPAQQRRRAGIDADAIVQAARGMKR